MRPFEIQAKCEPAAKAIAALPISSWSGWVTYILEALQGEAGNDADYIEMIDSVAKPLNARLNEGRW